MTKTEFDRFSNLLTARQAELARAVALREGIVIERTADALDEVQFAAARELRTRTLERESSLLRDVRMALDRIADDTAIAQVRAQMAAAGIKDSDTSTGRAKRHQSLAEQILGHRSIAKLPALTE